MDDILYRFQRISYYVTQSVDLYFEKVYKYKYIYIHGSFYRTPPKKGGMVPTLILTVDLTFFKS